MTKSLTLFLICLAVSVSGWAQNFKFEDHKTQNDGIRKLVERVNVAKTLPSRDATCGEDTVFYPDAKRTSSFVSLIYLRNNPTSLSRAAQWYEVPAGDSITISGFAFTANVEKSVAVNDTIAVVASLYSSTTDSLPDVLLATTTVNVDTAGQSGVGTEYYANFSSPVTVDGNFLLVIQNPDTARLAVEASSVSEMHGAGEFLSSGGTPTNWFSSKNITFQGGLLLDADWMFFPFVTFDISTDFGGDTCLLLNGVSNFENTSSPIIYSRFYNILTFLDVFVGRPDSTFEWDYGDGSTNDYTLNGSHSFTPTSNMYDVTLGTLLIGWTTICFDGVVKTFPTGIKANAAFSTNFDRSTNTASFTNSSTGDSFEWDFGDGNTSTTANPTHQYVDTSGIFVITLVAVRNANCPSSDTLRDTIDVWATHIQDDLLNQQVQVYPNPSKDNFFVDVSLEKAEMVSLEVHNMVGQRVAVIEPRKVTQERFTLNLSNQQAGIYFLTLRSDGRQITRKLTRY